MPAGTPRRPVANEAATALALERAETKQYGEVQRRRQNRGDGEAHCGCTKRAGVKILPQEEGHSGAHRGRKPALTISHAVRGGSGSHLPWALSRP